MISKLDVSTMWNKTIRSIKNAELLGVYCYLNSLKDGEKYPLDNIKEHFNISEEDAGYFLRKLEELGLVSLAHMHKIEIYEAPRK